jgi:hypothetical protein
MTIQLASVATECRGLGTGIGSLHVAFAVCWAVLRRHFLTAAAIAMVVVGLPGCEKRRTPAEQVGDAFVDRYVRADQEGAMAYAALGAAAQLKKEQVEAKEARIDGQVPDVHATYTRIGEETREARTVLRYEVRTDGKDGLTRTMRLELADLGRGLKVVLFELK